MNIPNHKILSMYPYKSSSSNQPVSFKVISSVELTTIYYTVVGRTGVMKSSPVHANILKEFEFSINFETWMIPEVQVIVHYIHSTGEVIYDTASVKFEDNLPNNVSISFWYSDLI